MLRLDILDVCIAFEKLLLRDIVNDAKHRILGNQQHYNYMKIIFILQFKYMQICLREAKYHTLIHRNPTTIVIIY